MGSRNADLNLKTPLVAAIDTPITKTILKDDQSGGCQGKGGLLSRELELEWP